MKIAVGSTNPAKIEAVKEAFQKVWPKKKWEVIGVDVKSVVSNQPMSDTESIKGAISRAKQALKKSKADFAVGIEAGIHQIGKYWFDCGWMVVIDKEGNEGIGSSIRMHTPPRMIKMVREGKEIGEINDIIFKVKNSKHGIGHFGLMTNGAVNRTSAYTDGIISALARFINPDLY